MSLIDELFSYGNITEEVKIGSVSVKLVPLSTKKMIEAFDASLHLDSNAQALEYKKQILSRSIVSISGIPPLFEDINKPTSEEIQKVNDLLGKLHVSILNKLYDAFDKLDNDVSKEKEVLDELKK